MLQKTLRPVQTVHARLSVLLAADSYDTTPAGDARGQQLPLPVALRRAQDADVRWQPSTHAQADAAAAAPDGPMLSTHVLGEPLNVSSQNRWQIVADEFSVVLAVALPFVSSALRADPSQSPGAGCLSVMVRCDTADTALTR